MATLEDKVVLVTGAAKRVGAVIAKRLHAEGALVVIHHRSSVMEAQALLDELEAERPDSAALVKAELLEPGAPERIVEEAVGVWGRLDGLVNNASVFYPTKVGEVTLEQWDEVIGINLRVPLFLCQAAAPHLRAARGAIVNIADIYAHKPLKGFPVYNVAKAGLVMLTRTMARELGPEVRVNAVAPGAILWPEEGTVETSQRRIIAQTALERQGEPEDIAGAVLYLLRDATYVTGDVLAVDGGRTLSP